MNFNGSAEVLPSQSNIIGQGLATFFSNLSKIKEIVVLRGKVDRGWPSLTTHVTRNMYNIGNGGGWGIGWVLRKWGGGGRGS